MPDLSCHRQAIISALRDRGGDARTQLSSCLPSSPLFPIVLARAVQAAVTSHRPEGAGKAAPGMPAVHPGMHPIPECRWRSLPGSCLGRG